MPAQAGIQAPVFTDATTRFGTVPIPERGRSFGIKFDIIVMLDRISEDIEELRRNPKGVRFNDLARICDRHFGEPRQRGTSHRIYSMPWPVDPRVNIQGRGGMAKPFQVRQVIRALERLREMP